MEVFFHKTCCPTTGWYQITAEFKNAGPLGFVVYLVDRKEALVYPPEEANEGLVAEWWDHAQMWDRPNVPKWAREAVKKWLPILKKMV